ncbi:PREDICTED: uncharacterized protein LOC106813112 [Priapulus caudatus]|uniref:Uncharacterized protein LOC106813112 n=1 Tax=Priapulus caudatus TaxID=37621 RepID=A0ABM1EKD3_PRICU|nr:PREDICTED: uncharacterized protein LOC106813112 [Priapulus caudatus]
MSEHILRALLLCVAVLLMTSPPRTTAQPHDRWIKTENEVDGAKGYYILPKRAQWIVYNTGLKGHGKRDENTIADHVPIDMISSLNQDDSPPSFNDNDHRQKMFNFLRRMLAEQTAAENKE